VFHDDPDADRATFSRERLIRCDHG
jgi:hypothetical protein